MRRRGRAGSAGDRSADQAQAAQATATATPFTANGDGCGTVVDTTATVTVRANASTPGSRARRSVRTHSPTKSREGARTIAVSPMIWKTMPPPAREIT